VIIAGTQWPYGYLYQVPDGSGVYVLYRGSEKKCVYVGRNTSGSLRSRLSTHETHLDFFSFIVLPDT